MAQGLTLSTNAEINTDENKGMFIKFWQPRRESNPYCMLEKHVS